MEEIEISSWLTLDAIQDSAEIVDTIGDLQLGHGKYIFCMIEDDYLELGYLDTVSNFLRRYENKEEFKSALTERKEEMGEIPYDEDQSFNNDFEDDDIDGEDHNSKQDTEDF